MERILSYITTLLAGVIAGLLIFFKLKNPETVINENTQIGKIKQRGQGNDASVTVEPGHAADESVVVKTRQQMREERKANRIARRRERRAQREGGSP